LDKAEEQVKVDGAPLIHTKPAMSRSMLAYVLFFIFCALSSLRDVLSERLFKLHGIGLSPVFVLFVYSVETQFIAFVIIAARHLRRDPDLVRSSLGELIALNVFTLIAYLTFFLAINTQLGAALNSFVDYGTGPVFTAIAGWVFLKERLNSRFVAAAMICSAGILLFAFPLIAQQRLTFNWCSGVLFALASSAAGAMYRIYYKMLLNQGVSKSAIVLYRLSGLSFVLGAILIFRPQMFRSQYLGQVATVGLVGFTGPLFLILFVLQKVRVAHFSIMLFLMPVLTYAFACWMKLTRPSLGDLAAGAVIFLGVAVYEMSRGRAAS
jgi:drug/metabolite transporter (DMT)-like permease